jgi:hypothetical protein
MNFLFRFVKIVTALIVPDHCIFATAVLHHGCRDFSAIGAEIFPEVILRTYLDSRSLGQIGSQD